MIVRAFDDVISEVISDCNLDLEIKPHVFFVLF